MNFEIIYCFFFSIKKWPKVCSGAWRKFKELSEIILSSLPLQQRSVEIQVLVQVIQVQSRATHQVCLLVLSMEITWQTGSTFDLTALQQMEGRKSRSHQVRDPVSCGLWFSYSYMVLEPLHCWMIEKYLSESEYEKILVFYCRFLAKFRLMMHFIRCRDVS